MATNIDELFMAMLLDADWLPEWDKLPVFGGEAPPTGTEHVWSWDDEYLIVGTCSEDLEILTREEWGERLEE